jgi:hypothetical protein
MGMKSATKIRRFQVSVNISEIISDLLNKFKVRNYEYHFEIIEEILRIKMILTEDKMFLYKLTLLCITIQNRYNEGKKTDQYGFMLPVTG